MPARLPMVFPAKSKGAFSFCNCKKPPSEFMAGIAHPERMAIFLSYTVQIPVSLPCCKKTVVCSLIL
jgi:hypothetical protein